MFRILIAAGAVLITAYLSALYTNPLLLSLLFAELFVLLPSLLLLLIGSRGLSVKLRIPVSVAERNSGFWVEVFLENKSRILLPFVEAQLIYQNHFEEKKHRARAVAAAGAKGSSRARFFYPGKHCGKVIFTMQKVYCYDWLHLFRIPIRTVQSAELVVLPKYRELEREAPEEIITDYGQGFDEHKSGDDPSEVFGLRQYRPGDSMSRVHWKMTARTGELFVREFGLPLDCPSIFFLQMIRQTLKELDAYMDEFFSIGCALLKEKSYWLVWYDVGEGLLERRLIDSEDALWEALEAVFSMELPQQEQDLCTLYEQQFPNDWHEGVLLLDSKLNLLGTEGESGFEEK